MMATVTIQKRTRKKGVRYLVSYKVPMNGKKKHYKTMPVFEFIKAIIQHIPDRNFKMIRYYGAYCRKLKKRYLFYLLRKRPTLGCNFITKK